MEEIVLSSGSDSDSDIEIIFSAPSQEIVLLENDCKRRRRCTIENKYDNSREYISLDKTNYCQNYIASHIKPTIPQVSSIKPLVQQVQSLPEHLISLLKKTYVFKNLKFVETYDLSFSEELFSKFSSWQTIKNTHYLTLFISWIRMAPNKSIDLNELLNFLDTFLNTAASMDQKSADINFLSEFLIKFSQSIDLLSIRSDGRGRKDSLDENYLAELHSTKMRIQEFISKILKYSRRIDFKMFLTFFKIIFDIYKVFILFTFNIKLKLKDNPFILKKYFQQDEKFIYETIDHFKSKMLLFEINIEFFKSIHFATYCEIIQYIVLANLAFCEKQTIKRHTNEIFYLLENVYSKLNSRETKLVFRNQILSQDEIKLKFGHHLLLQLSNIEHISEAFDEYLELLEEYLVAFSRLEPNIHKNALIVCLFDIDVSCPVKQRIIDLFYDVNLTKHLDQKSALYLKNLIAQFV